MAKKRVGVRGSDKKSSKLAYANGLAAVFMFFSWLCQNIYQNEVSSEKAGVERNVQFVSSEMSKALTWMLAFQAEIRKDKPDPEVVLNTAMNYAATTQTIVEAAGMVDPNSAALKRHISEHRKIYEPIKNAAARQDINEIKEGASFMMLWFGRIGPEAHQAINHRFNELNNQEDIAKWIFRGFFLLGSIVFAATWWRANITTNIGSPTHL